MAIQLHKGQADGLRAWRYIFYIGGIGFPSESNEIRRICAIPCNFL